MIAVAIATPVAYYFTNERLQGFAYHISVEWWVFAIASVMAAMIAFMTVSIQAVKAAVQKTGEQLAVRVNLTIIALLINQQRSVSR